MSSTSLGTSKPCTHRMTHVCYLNSAIELHLVFHQLRLVRLDLEEGIVGDLDSLPGVHHVVMDP